MPSKRRAMPAFATEEFEGTSEKPASNGANVIAACILMTVMYAARMARPDLLRAVGQHARKLTKWGRLEDRKMRRLVEYINSSHTQHGWHHRRPQARPSARLLLRCGFRRG